MLPLLASAWTPAGWTDRSEYDLVLKIRMEASPQKQLELLDQWKRLYPQSEMRQQRRELFLAAYQASGDAAHVFETAREMVADSPDNFVGVYWCTLLVPQKQLTNLTSTPKKPCIALADIERFLGDADAHDRDPQGFMQASRRHGDLQAEVAAAEDEWLRLELLREEMESWKSSS